MIVIGLDLSLTSTGIARIHTGISTRTWTVTSTGRRGDSLAARAERLEAIRDAVAELLGDAEVSEASMTDHREPVLAVIEGPSYAQAHPGSGHDRSGLWWALVDDLLLRGIPVVEVPPACRARYATGKGNAAKDRVLAAVVRRYPEVEVEGNDQADALVLAAMGARALGEPIDDPLPESHLAAMKPIAWPNRKALP